MTETEFDEVADKACRAWWNAVPFHVDYDKYLNAHPEKDVVKATMHRCMRAAMTAVGVVK